MSLKGLEIDPFLLAGLYPRTLVQPAIKSRPAAVAAPAVIPSLGNNTRKILLLISNGEAAYLGEHAFELLSNLLGACKLTMDDVALVNTARGPLEAASLFSQFLPEKIILFGDPLPELSAGHPKNKPWKEAGRELLLTEALEDMQREVQLKVPFWKALQVFFNLNPRK
jgi:hypothetical protein